MPHGSPVGALSGLDARMLEAPAGRYLAVHGNRLFVDERGAAGAPPVLVVHGGPGEGCGLHGSAGRPPRANRSGDRRRPAGLPALRPSPGRATHSLDDIVSDLDGLRDSSAVPAWALIGHSFGANIALRSATTHPEQVSAVVFENPT